jgi:Tol biopolymer transport system component
VTTAVHPEVVGPVGRIAVIDLEAKTVVPITPVDELLTGNAVFARDGRAIVYVRINVADDIAELASIGFDGGRAIDLPPDLEGELPRFSPDGRYLAYCKLVQVGINRVPARFIRRLADGETQQILPPENFPNLGCITDWVR